MGLIGLQVGRTGVNVHPHRLWRSADIDGRDVLVVAGRRDSCDCGSNVASYWLYCQFYFGSPDYSEILLF